MTLAARIWFLPTIIVCVIVLVGVAAALTHPVSSIRDEGTVRDVVTAFVASEKNISHLDHPKDTIKEIRQYYGQLVAASLLEQWITEPALAPGRRELDSWPDQIAIDTVAPQGAGYILTGKVLMLSGDPPKTNATGTIPVIVFLIKEGNIWQIAAYQEQTLFDSATH